jgi:hypothetical protein
MVCSNYNIPTLLNGIEVWTLRRIPKKQSSAAVAVACAKKWRYRVVIVGRRRRRKRRKKEKEFVVKILTMQGGVVARGCDAKTCCRGQQPTEDREMD